MKPKKPKAEGEKCDATTEFLEKPEHGLTDLVGTMIVAKDQRELDQIRGLILDGKAGPVIEEEDKYTCPQNGYRAYHYLIIVNDMPIELQLKTKRMKVLAEASHTLYKNEMLNGDKFLELTGLAHEADKGNPEAQQEFKRRTSDMSELTKYLTKD